MSRRAVAIRHISFEDLGILAPMLSDHGYQVRYLDAGIDPLGTGSAGSDAAVEADLLVVLGGPIGVHDGPRYPFLAHEADVIAARLAADRPMLGVCLGAQLIAHGLGAEVRAGDGVEIGYSPLTLSPEGAGSPLGALGDVPVLHWHGEEFAVPAGAARLAATPGWPNQAFSMGTSVLGLQFHLEADHTQIERWLTGHAVELAVNGIDPDVIRRDARRHGPVLAERARLVFDAWLSALER